MCSLLLSIVNFEDSAIYLKVEKEACFGAYSWLGLDNMVMVIASNTCMGKKVFLKFNSRGLRGGEGLF